MKKATGFHILTLIFISVMLTGCGKHTSAGGMDETLLIDEMAQIDFDIDYPVGQITKGVTVTQSFIGNCDSISQIWLYGATYMRDNTATVSVKLYVLEPSSASEEGEGKEAVSDDREVIDAGKEAVSDSDPVTDGNGESRTLLDEWIIDSSEMEDNSIIKLDVTPSEINSGLTGLPFLIEISSPDGEPDLSPTFWMTEEDVYPDGNLAINGYAQYNDLWFQVTGH